MTRRLNILILYVSNQYPMRATLWDQLYCFRRYSDHNCFYLNFSLRRVPWYLRRVKFDLIVFGTLFLATRADDEWFRDPRERAQPLKSFDAVRIIFPQDEYLRTDILADFINEFSIDRVFSLAPKTEWPKIYDRVDTTRVKLSNVLAGYLDDATVKRIERLAGENLPRDLDLGYRTWRAAPNLGRHGFLRKQIADVFQAEAPKHNLKIDISTRKEDTLWADAWYEFLLRCKYTISVEGGASVLDRDGSIQRKTESYLLEHPAAPFDEVEQECFPGLDGGLRYVAISPRHLEACATRTCQVLVEGEYNYVLVAGRHYIELKRDFSNLEEVLEILEQDKLRKEITDNAYRDIVESGNYAYRSFVDQVLRESVPELQQDSGERSDLWSSLIYHWMRMSDFLAWVQVALNLHSFGAQARNKTRRLLAALLSEETVVSVTKRVRRNGSK
ncbi:MAG TPA: hypothetical protein VLN44_00690 [Pyrinomonadaceae bacterium]|nr:hypothetical protein [Pyrinomonadaceae bacterium]